jgi:hypothetical protein
MKLLKLLNQNDSPQDNQQEDTIYDPFILFLILILLILSDINILK